MFICSNRLTVSNLIGLCFSDCQLQSHSRSINEKKFDAGSLAIPSKRTLNSLTATDKKEKKNDVQTGSFGYNANLS